MSAPRCRQCRQRPALAKVNGRYRVVKDHDLCRQCFESTMDGQAARKVPPARPRGPQVPMPELLE